jgi:hypothetical protein
MTLGQWSNAANFSFVLLSALTAAVGIGAWYLGKQVAEEKDAQMAQLNLEVLKQREKTAKAMTALLELQERTRQRTFTPAQREHLISSLKSVRTSGFEIWGQEGDPESSAFAEQFVGVLGEAGGSMQEMILPEPHAPKGVTIRVHSKDNIPEYAARFLRAAGEIGLTVAVEVDPKDQRLSETCVYLIVGSKLPP